MSKLILQDLSVEDVIFVCIGTDRSTGDALGPLVGMYLEELGYTNVIGTIDNLCHASNLQERLNEIPEGKTVIAIDACLGRQKNIGDINYYAEGLRPGAGVGKDLGIVGDYCIKGIVNIGGHLEYFVLQNTQLSRVMSMAKEIVSDIASMIPLNQLQIAATLED